MYGKNILHDPECIKAGQIDIFVYDIYKRGRGICVSGSNFIGSLLGQKFLLCKWLVYVINGTFSKRIRNEYFRRYGNMKGLASPFLPLTTLYLNGWRLFSLCWLLVFILPPFLFTCTIYMGQHSMSQLFLWVDWRHEMTSSRVQLKTQAIILSTPHTENIFVKFPFIDWNKLQAINPSHQLCVVMGRDLNKFEAESDLGRMLHTAKWMPFLQTIIPYFTVYPLLCFLVLTGCVCMLWKGDHLAIKRCCERRAIGCLPVFLLKEMP